MSSMIYKQIHDKFPFQLFYAVTIFSVLFLLSFWWKMHGISVQLQNEYAILLDLDQQTLQTNVTIGHLVSTQIKYKEGKSIHIATSVYSSLSERTYTKPRESAAILIKSVIISALLYNVPQLTFHIFLQDYEQDSNYFASLQFDKNVDKNLLKIELYSYPVVETIPQEYRQNILDTNFYCLYNKLFLSTVLANVGAVIYIDNSMIMIDNISMFWDQFKGMHPYELIGVAVVPEPYATRDHKNTKAHTKGMDSNLLFMNLTRMRENHWQNNFLHLYQQGTKQLGYFISDQQLIYTLLYYGTDAVMPITCQFDFILSTESCCVHAEKDSFGIRAMRPDFNSPLSVKTVKLIHDLVKSTHLRTSENTTTYFQDAFVIPLRQLVASALGNRTMESTRNATTNAGETTKKNKCEMPIYKLIFRQLFG